MISKSDLNGQPPGWTLVETIAVMAVVGVIAGMAYNFSSKPNVDKSKLKSDAENLKQALLRHMSQVKGDPNTWGCRTITRTSQSVVSISNSGGCTTSNTGTGTGAYTYLRSPRTPLDFLIPSAHADGNLLKGKLKSIIGEDSTGTAGHGSGDGGAGTGSGTGTGVGTGSGSGSGSGTGTGTATTGPGTAGTSTGNPTNRSPQQLWPSGGLVIPASEVLTGSNFDLYYDGRPNVGNNSSISWTLSNSDGQSVSITIFAAGIVRVE